MNAQSLAHRAYSQTARSAGTPMDTEYQAIARITHKIKAAAEAGPRSYPKLVEALSDNQRLWTTLAVDVADPRNELSQDVRARIFFLAEFVRKQTSEILQRKAKIAPLLEVNAAILRGLAAGRNRK